MQAAAEPRAGLKKTLGCFLLERRLAPRCPAAKSSFELTPREGRTPNAAALETLVAHLAEHANVGIGGGRRSGLRRYSLPGGGFLRVPAGGFTQVNWAVNTALVAAIVEGAASRGAKTFLDLYAGVGNFSVPLALAGLSGTAIEREHTATAALREALREQALSAVEGAQRAMSRRRSNVIHAAARVDLVLLDPPRSGAKDVLSPLVAEAPRALGYVACDPVTLARDLRVLLAQGYVLEGVTCFDMFPQTHHVETLAWLARA